MRHCFWLVYKSSYERASIMHFSSKILRPMEKFRLDVIFFRPQRIIFLLLSTSRKNSARDKIRWDSLKNKAETSRYKWREKGIMLMFRGCLTFLSLRARYLRLRIQMYHFDNLRNSSCNIPRPFHLIHPIVDRRILALTSLLPCWLILNLAKFIFEFRRNRKGWI